MDDDARMDPRLKALVKKYPEGTLLDMVYPAEPIMTSREEILKFRASLLAEVQQLNMKVMGELMQDPRVLAAHTDLSSAGGLHVSDHSFVSSPDRNTVKLRLYRLSGAQGALPLVYYIHGGGMRSGSAFDPNYTMWAQLVARQSVAVAVVDFRNAEIPTESSPEIAPYPAGLNDCFSGLEWCHGHAAELGVDPGRIVVAGESGGGNLTIATVLKAKRQGRLGLVSGFYALSPYIAGSWPQNVQDRGPLGSSHLAEVNDGYIISVGGQGNYELSNGAVGYGVEAFLAKDPLAWPGLATEDDLRGLPRCVVTVDECDPLRDEGIIFYRRLLAAGVPARCWQMMGCVHTAAVNLAGFVPDIAEDAAQSLAGFAKGSVLPAARL